MKNEEVNGAGRSQNIGNKYQGAAAPLNYEDEENLKLETGKLKLELQLYKTLVEEWQISWT